MSSLHFHDTLPGPILIALGTLAVVQLIVMLWALVRLFFDKRNQVAGLPRFVWAIAIVVANLIGPIVFLILHTRERRALDQQRIYQESVSTVESPQGNDASTIIDNLYRK